MQNQNLLPTHTQDDEIDLFELAAALWSWKWLIVGITAIVVSLAVAYLVVTPKVYEAKVFISKTHAVNVAQLNAGKEQLGSYAQSVSPTSVFDLFQQKLQSRSLAMVFFKGHIEPVLREQGVAGSTSDLLYGMFFNSIKTEVPSAGSAYLTVAYQYKDPRFTAEWLNGYLNFIEQQIKQELINSALYNKTQAVNDNEKEIASLRSVFKRRVQDTIFRLEEAFEIAKKLDIQKPATSNLAEKVVSNQLDESLLFMRGYEVIRAEIESLQARKSVDPFIEKIRPIQENISYLDSIEYDINTLQVINVDAWSEVPEKRIKPKKAMVLVFAGLLGGMLGVFVSLLLWVVSKRKVRGG